MQRKIGFKLIFVVGLTAIIIIGVYAYINIRSQSQVLLAEVERHANQLSESLESSTRHEMLMYHGEQIQGIISTVSEDPCLNQIRIINKEGEIKYSTNKAQIGTMVKKNEGSCYTCHAEDKPLEKLTIPQKTRIFKTHPDSARVMGVIAPIFNELSCWESDCHIHPAEQKVLGILDIVMCLKEVDKQIQESEIRAGLFAIVAILAISIIIGIFVHRWVDKPVNYLLEATKQVASGNLSYTIDDLGEDELGLLAKSFNNMTRKLAEARQQLFQSDKMASLGRLAAGVAHEINNPLTGVLTYSSFLLKRMKNMPDVQEDLQVIVRETLRSREIVKGLLDFARQSIPKKKNADLNSIIDKAVSVVVNQLQLKHVKVVRNLENDLPEITVDANQIQQVYINLMVNAADAMSENGGDIVISSSLISLSLYGNQPIKQATCPKNHSLIDEENKIGGLPSIKVKATTEDEQGFIFLDPIYGKNRNQYSVPYERNKQVGMCCPECDSSLISEGENCPKCDSSVYSIIIPSKGVLNGCTRVGCGWQKWDVVDSIGKIRYIECKVADNGCGIAEDELVKIFEPFYTTKGQKGTGLGLSVIWGIMDNHGGSISVSSKVNKGTTFTLRLPVEQYV